MATFRHLDMRALALQLALALGFGVAYRVNDTNHIKFAKTSEGFEMCGRACELSVIPNELPSQRKASKIRYFVTKHLFLSTTDDPKHQFSTR